ncbi:MAG: hypothetical protein D6765_04225 [Bacteroidetes bacterium]|nr:MAG: hypothetical protein D6765_04225 [Bacteroidota bacterium]
MTKFSPLLALLLLCAPSCIKDEGTIQLPGYTGVATALQNGTFWTARTYADTNPIRDDRVEIFLDSLSDESFIHQSLSFHKVPPSPGTYPILFTTPYLDDERVGARFDVREQNIYFASYQVPEGDTLGMLDITAFDSLSGLLEGRFELTLAVEFKALPHLPDTVRFREGRFQVILSE